MLCLLCKRPALWRGRVVASRGPARTSAAKSAAAAAAAADTPDQCVRIAAPVAAGDVLVIASDGLYDNLFDEQILQAGCARARVRVCACLCGERRPVGPLLRLPVRGGRSE